jgi:hypothetical protein
MREDGWTEGVSVVEVSFADAMVFIYIVEEE